MTGFSEALATRARNLGVQIPSDAIEPFETYTRLLSRWNQTVNLTALPIDELRDEAIDRLLLEPAVAALHIPPDARTWIDLGSGGGSPAIPIKILRPELALTMIESRERKVAFLREVVRELRLEQTGAEAERFENLVGKARWTAAADIVTARAVRTDKGFVALVAQMLRSGGSLLLFEGQQAVGIDSPALELRSRHRLLPARQSQLTIYTKIT